MNDKAKEKSIVDQIPSQIMDLMLDVILDVMRAERGSIMLVDETCQELTIQSARGLKNEIIKKARVRLGEGVSGKVAVMGHPVFLKGLSGERRFNINPNDLTNPDIDTSYVVPIRLHNGTIGTVNINSRHQKHEILAEKAGLVQGILHRFIEYLAQVESPPGDHKTPSQLYMMNIFREYSTLRELRVVFDYIFHLVTDLMVAKEKGVFLLTNEESGFFDLVLGYGLDTRRYREIYEELVPCLKEPKFQSVRNITILNRKELFVESPSFFQEDYYILLPLIWRNRTQGLLFIFADKKPRLENIENILQSVCEAGARVIQESASGQKLRELTFTDSLTGTYNYGFWWKRLHEEFSRMKRLKETNLSVIVFDIQHFKKINRAHGYLVGDQLLRVIADGIKSCLRINDILGRIGGNEFGIVLPGTSKQAACVVGGRILDAVSGLQSEIRVQLSHPLALSGGMAAGPDDADTPEKLVERAKIALVSAKIMGGNRIQSFEHLEE